MTSDKNQVTGNQPAPRSPKGQGGKPEAADWQRMWFKTNKVWMALDENGNPVIKDGKVLIKYQLEQDYEYWVKQSSVNPLDSPPPKTQVTKKDKEKATITSKSMDETAYRDKICVFTDGASSGGICLSKVSTR